MHQAYAVANNSPPVRERTEQRKIERKNNNTHITAQHSTAQQTQIHVLAPYMQYARYIE